MTIIEDIMHSREIENSPRRIPEVIAGEDGCGDGDGCGCGCTAEEVVRRESRPRGDEE